MSNSAPHRTTGATSNDTTDLSLTTTFEDLGILYYQFIGTWNDEVYQASIWVRYACAQDPNNREVRLVVTLNTAPEMHRNPTDSHAVLNPKLGARGQLPYIRYSSSTPGSIRFTDIKLAAWDKLVRTGWQTAAFWGKGTISANESYILSMENSERVYHVPKDMCTYPDHRVFPENSVYLGTHEKLLDRPEGVLEFVYLQQVYHHVKLGFDGMLWVVRPQMADQLLASKEVREVVRQRKLILIVWEYGVVEKVKAFMQVPAYNILRLAMYGSKGSTLAFWDPDEYLMLPRGKSIKEEVKSGCLQQVFTEEAEVVIPLAWARPSAGAFTEDAEYKEWMKRGSVPKAIREMNYTINPGRHCNWGVFCKAMITPDSDFTFHVHQLHRSGAIEESGETKFVPHTCAYIAHFYQMWHKRDIWDLAKSIWDPERPLNVTLFPV